MRKFLLSCLVVSLFVLSCFSFAVTIDLSEYDLPDLDTSDYPTAVVYSNYLVYTNNGTLLNFTDVPMTADNSKVYTGANSHLTQFYFNDGAWLLSNFDNGSDYSDDEYSPYSSIITANYTVYDHEDSSSVIYQPTQEGGGSSVSQIITDLGTVMTAVLDNATSLVTWITQNPLVYLWVIMAIIIAIIAFVRGFIRGV